MRMHIPTNAYHLPRGWGWRRRINRIPSLLSTRGRGWRYFTAVPTTTGNAIITPPAAITAQSHDFLWRGWSVSLIFSGSEPLPSPFPDTLTGDGDKVETSREALEFLSVAEKHIQGSILWLSHSVGLSIFLSVYPTIYLSNNATATTRSVTYLAA